MQFALLWSVSFLTLLLQATGAQAQLKQLEQLREGEWKRLAPGATILTIPLGLPAPPVPDCSKDCEVKVWVFQAGDRNGHPTKCSAVVALVDPITVAFGAKPKITWRIESPYAAGVDTGEYEFKNNGIRMKDEVEFGRRYHGSRTKDIERISTTDKSETWQVKNERRRDSLLCNKEEDDDGDGGENVRRCEIHYAAYVKRKDPVSGTTRNCVPLDPTLINKGS